MPWSSWPSPPSPIPPPSPSLPLAPPPPSPPSSPPRPSPPPPPPRPDGARPLPGAKGRAREQRARDTAGKVRNLRSWIELISRGRRGAMPRRNGCLHSLAFILSARARHCGEQVFGGNLQAHISAFAVNVNPASLSRVFSAVQGQPPAGHESRCSKRARPLSAPGHRCSHRSSCGNCRCNSATSCGPFVHAGRARLAIVRGRFVQARLHGGCGGCVWRDAEAIASRRVGELDGVSAPRCARVCRHVECPRAALG